VFSRTKSHFYKNSKFSDFSLKANPKRYFMPGSTKLEREVFEQFLIINSNKLGVRRLLNVVNPMGGRVDLYNKMWKNVLKKYNLKP
jgi:hypothetical protein